MNKKQTICRKERRHQENPKVNYVEEMHTVRRYGNTAIKMMPVWRRHEKESQMVAEHGRCGCTSPDASAKFPASIDTGNGSQCSLREVLTVDTI